MCREFIKLISLFIIKMKLTILLTSYLNLRKNTIILYTQFASRTGCASTGWMSYFCCLISCFAFSQMSLVSIVSIVWILWYWRWSYFRDNKCVTIIFYRLKLIDRTVWSEDYFDYVLRVSLGNKLFGCVCISYSRLLQHLALALWSVWLNLACSCI